MARPLRIEYPGAVYHITSRGNGRGPIFLGDTDRYIFLEILQSVVAKHNLLCHAYCLMDNHYHLLLETPDANLSLGMRQLNGVYTQKFNRLHNRVGHVFQGRYKAILVEKNEHLLELCRYVVLNPVRASMVNDPQKWFWSSYQATASLVNHSGFLTVDWVLGQFANNKKMARKEYIQFVADGLKKGDGSLWEKLVGQIVLGSADFVADIQGRISEIKECKEVPRIQRLPNRPSLESLFSNEKIQNKVSRNRQIEAAHMQYAYTLKEIASQLDIHYTTVSKVLKNLKK